MARAKFSTWLGATKPTFINVDSPKLVTLQMLRARHPLLVQQHQEVLRERKANLKSRSRVLSFSTLYIQVTFLQECTIWVNISCDSEIFEV